MSSRTSRHTTPLESLAYARPAPAPIRRHPTSPAHSPSVSDASLSDEQLEEALAQRSTATKALLGRLLDLYPSDSALPKVEELQQKCHQLLEQVRCAPRKSQVAGRLLTSSRILLQSLRSQEALRMLRVEHETVLAQLEETHTDLLRAEKRLDRVQSSTVAAIEGRSLAKPEPVASPSSLKRSVSFANVRSRPSRPCDDRMNREARLTSDFVHVGLRSEGGSAGTTDGINSRAGRLESTS